MSMSFPLLLLCCCRWLCLCRCLASADVLIESAPWRSMPKNTQKEVVNFLAVVQGKWRRRDTERGGEVHHTPCCLRDAISTTHTHMSPTWWAAPLSTRSSSFCLCQANFRVGSTWHYPDTRPDPDDAKWNGFWSNENCMHIIRPKKELFIHFEDIEFDRKPKYSKSDNLKGLSVLFCVDSQCQNTCCHWSELQTCRYGIKVDFSISW